MSAPIPNPEVQSQTRSPFEHELAQLIAEVTNLELTAEQIDPTAALFGEGLGLDSIDLLEIALVVSQRYGVALRSDDPDNRAIFASLRNLAAQHRQASQKKVPMPVRAAPSGWFGPPGYSLSPGFVDSPLTELIGNVRRSRLGCRKLAS
jgi:acyl carrier protein